MYCFILVCGGGVGSVFYFGSNSKVKWCVFLCDFLAVCDGCCPMIIFFVIFSMSCEVFGMFVSCDCVKWVLFFLCVWRWCVRCVLFWVEFQGKMVCFCDFLAVYDGCSFMRIFFVIF